MDGFQIVVVEWRKLVATRSTILRLKLAWALRPTHRVSMRQFLNFHLVRGLVRQSHRNGSSRSKWAQQNRGSSIPMSNGRLRWRRATTKRRKMSILNLTHTKTHLCTNLTGKTSCLCVLACSALAKIELKRRLRESKPTPLVVMIRYNIMRGREFLHFARARPGTASHQRLMLARMCH